jgi:aryl-alcohol dehydrogenase-like predicted oxidoreductase
MAVDRRTFLKLGAAAAAAPLAAAAPVRAGAPATRRLGRTGLAVSELGMGVMITANADVVRAALDAGVTYFDTARAYMGGRNEEILAAGLGARRHQAVVATKCANYGRAASIVASCEQSLVALKTDWIDVFQLHGVGGRGPVLSAESLEGLAALKKSGKIRFAGVTTHASMIEVIDAAIEAGVYDTVLTTFNFREPPGLGDAVRRAAAAGLGVVAMKVMAGGYRDAGLPGLDPFQAALRWVLKQPGVATTIPSLVTFEQLDRDLEAAGVSFGARDALALELYAAAIEGRHCRVCGGCAGQCPRGADVPAIMRALMYAEGYGQPSLAAETLAAARFPCAACGGCTVVCRSGLRLAERVAAAVRLGGAARA